LSWNRPRKLTIDMPKIKDIRFHNILLLVERKKKKENMYFTRWGVEKSQVIPVCPHKSIVVFQLKDPFEDNELYQFTKIVCSSVCNAPF